MPTQSPPEAKFQTGTFAYWQHREVWYRVAIIDYRWNTCHGDEYEIKLKDDWAWVGDSELITEEQYAAIVLAT